MLIPSKLDSKYKHMHTKVLGLNVMIKNMLQVLFVFISPNRKSPAGCNGSLDAPAFNTNSCKCLNLNLNLASWIIF